MSDKPGRKVLTVLDLKECLDWVVTDKVVATEAVEAWLSWLNPSSTATSVITLTKGYGPDGPAADVHSTLFEAFSRKRETMVVVFTP